MQALKSLEEIRQWAAGKAAENPTAYVGRGQYPYHCPLAQCHNELYGATTVEAYRDYKNWNFGFGKACCGGEGVPLPDYMCLIIELVDEHDCGIYAERFLEILDRVTVLMQKKEQ